MKRIRELLTQSPDDKPIVVKGWVRTKREAVTEALEEYVRKLRHGRVLSLFGKIDFQPEYDYKKQRTVKSKSLQSRTLYKSREPWASAILLSPPGSMHLSVPSRRELSVSARDGATNMKPSSRTMAVPNF